MAVGIEKGLNNSSLDRKANDIKKRGYYGKSICQAQCLKNVSFSSEFFGSEFVNSERCRVISTGQTIFA